MVSGMIDSRLTREFLADTAYGDLIMAALALAAIFALRSSWALAIPLAWVANTWGFLDLLNALRTVVQTNFPNYDLRTIWYIYIFYGPMVLVAHVLIFWVLLKSKSWSR